MLKMLKNVKNIEKLIFYNKYSKFIIWIIKPKMIKNYNLKAISNK